MTPRLHNQRKPGLTEEEEFLPPLLPFATFTTSGTSQSKTQDSFF